MFSIEMDDIDVCVSEGNMEIVQQKALLLEA